MMSPSEESRKAEEIVMMENISYALWQGSLHPPPSLLLNGSPFYIMIY